jgi:GT2 family glycosyltransferase
LDNKPLITIGVLNWNGLERLKKTMPSILKQVYENKEIFYIDNGSDDGSLKYLSGFSGIKVIRNKENLGTSKARNILIEKASGEYILMLDNDMELSDNDFLERILEDYLKLDKPAFLSPLNIDYGAEYINPVALYFNIIQLKKIKAEEIYRKGCFQVPGFNGNTFFFKKDIFLKLGGFDEMYPFNMDDYDLSARVNLYGYKNYVTTDLLAIHHGMDTRNNADSLAWKNKTYLCGFSRMIWKNYTLKNAIIWWPISSLWIFFKALKSSVQYRSVKPVIAHFSSFYYFVKDLPSTIKLRKEIQKNRIVKSDTFLRFKKLNIHGNNK